LENRFINAGFNTFIPLKNIEIITDLFHLKDFKVKKQELKLREKFINITGQNKSRSCVLTIDPTMFQSFIKSETIIREQYGENFLSIGSKFNSFINIDNIEFIAEYNKNRASIKKLLEERKYENRLYNLTRNNKYRSIIVMKKTENVYISPVRAVTLIDRMWLFVYKPWK